MSKLRLFLSKPCIRIPLKVARFALLCYGALVFFVIVFGLWAGHITSKDHPQPEPTRELMVGTYVQRDPDKGIPGLLVIRSDGTFLQTVNLPGRPAVKTSGHWRFRRGGSLQTKVTFDRFLCADGDGWAESKRLTLRTDIFGDDLYIQFPSSLVEYVKPYTPKKPGERRDR